MVLKMIPGKECIAINELSYIPDNLKRYYTPYWSYLYGYTIYMLFGGIYTVIILGITSGIQIELVNISMGLSKLSQVLEAHSCSIQV